MMVIGHENEMEMKFYAAGIVVVVVVIVRKWLYQYHHYSDTRQHI